MDLGCSQLVHRRVAHS